ncbi:radical SAM protein, partial [Candidatus Woesearchaeota archaeon]|nr:radical SAM protein [Candidatus Woesearchaeota archaeon]
GIVFRKVDFIADEMKALYGLGCRYFRLGKQSCFFSYPEIEELLKEIWKECPDIKVLHIDNANPQMVDEEKTKLIVKYCTPGNVAAFGVESFDLKVIEKNNLNSDPLTTLKAIRLINKCGKEIGGNGMPKFLPGINLLFGLKGESKNTHVENMKYLKQVMDENLLLRRINIRQVSIFPDTDLFKTTGSKFIKKNKKYYWKWRNEVRQKIDSPMLERLVPAGSVLKGIRMEIYDGNTTFGRQFGTYPLIVGIKERLELKKFYNVKIIGHMLRSVVGEVV